MKCTLRYLIITFFCLLTHFRTYSESNPGEKYSDHSTVSFIENNGQWQPEILYKATSTALSVSFLKDGISFAQFNAGTQSANEQDRSFIVWNMKYLNMSSGLKIFGSKGRSSCYSYLSGSDPSKWVIHPEEFLLIGYNNIYAGIDLHFYGIDNTIKNDYIVHAGADIDDIRACYQGVKKVSININGDLEIQTQWNTQIQKSPESWQWINGMKVPVKMEYVIINDTTFGFRSEAGYDKNHDLIIDPLFQMVWSTYTKIPGGGNNINYSFCNAMDKDGNVYLTGMVDGTFPVTPGAYSGPGNVYPEIFVAKFSNDGTTLLYGTYLPGNSSEFGIGIAVDDSGRAFVTGVVDLNITGTTTFPSTANAYQQVHDAGSDAFLTVLNATGTGLVYSSFLGGSGSEEGYSIALGGNGTAYITGNTSLGNFPVKNSSVFPTGDRDVFVAKFDVSQSGNNSLVYSVRIGGGPFTYCYGRSIAVDSAGHAFITGSINSSFGTPVYPTTNGVYTTVFNTGQDGEMSFVTKLGTATPVTLDYSTYLAPGKGNAIAIEKTSGDAFIAGSTFTFAFPVTTGALQTTHAGSGGTDAFVVRMNSTGSSLLYSTFLGGPFADLGTGLAVNSLGEAYVSGISQDSFPTSSGAYQPNNAGAYDFFVVNVNANGNGYGCGGSTYVGGSSADYTGSVYDYPAPHLSLQDHGGNNDTICVNATTHSQDFPTTPGVYGPTKINGISDQPVFFKLTCVPVSSVPSVDIFLADSSWCSKQTVGFTDNSTNNPTSWHWYFPGAVPDESTLQNPTGIFYPSNGIFDVTLVACNASGCDSVTFPGLIHVNPPPAPPPVYYYSDTICTGVYVAYRWYEVSTPGTTLSTNSCFVPQVPGNYSILVTDSNGCQNVTSIIILDVMEDTDKYSTVKVFPNPAGETITLDIYSKFSGTMQLSITDFLGKEVLLTSSNIILPGRNSFKIDLSGYANGIYFCNILSNDSFKSIKLVKR